MNYQLPYLFRTQRFIGFIITVNCICKNQRIETLRSFDILRNHPLTMLEIIQVSETTERSKSPIFTYTTPRRNKRNHSRLLTTRLPVSTPTTENRDATHIRLHRFLETFFV